MARTLAPGRIARPRLARKLSDAFDLGSVLLVAGAGYGKTTALEEAIDSSGRRAAWIYCGEVDADAGLLLRAVVQLLELDALDERAHRELMVGYARTGRTSQALRQFLECRRSMITVLGVEPSAETSGIQARILAGEPV